MGASGDFDPVVEAFAAAAVDPSHWDHAMQVVAGAAGGVGAVLFPIRGRLPNLHRSPAMEPVLEAYVRDGWIHRDERYRGVPTLMRRGVFTDLDYTDVESIERNPFYQEFLAPAGLRWAAVLRVAFDDDIWALSIQRSVSQSPFSLREVDRLAKLSRRLGSAGAVARALGFARAEAALTAFEASGLAVVLLDRHGTIVRLNTATERLLGSDLTIVRRRIVSFDHDATIAFDRALHGVLWAGTGPAWAPPAVLPRVEAPPVLAYFLRPPAICSDALAAAQAVVVLIDTGLRPRPPEAHLRAVFGLSMTEARLSLLLASGESLGGSADSLGITYETARTLLKRIYGKTGVSRQSQLTALLATLVLR